MRRIGERRVYFESAVKNSQEIENYQITVDLEKLKISDSHDFETDFKVDDFRRFCLFNGLDDIDLTRQQKEKIINFEKSRQNWLDFSI